MEARTPSRSKNCRRRQLFAKATACQSPVAPPYKRGMKIPFRSISVLAFTTSLAFAQEKAPEKIATSELPSSLSIYKDMHAHPELSQRGERTTALVAQDFVDVAS